MTASRSSNPPEELKQKLQALVPEAFKDGQLDVEVLKRSLGSETELRDESYALNWLAKSYARLLANENSLTWLKEDSEHNAKPENANSQNLLIKGDNLEVLKHLLGAYEEEIKLIYIDPPYNTGSDGFVYADDRKFTVEQLRRMAGVDEDEAKRILEFTQAQSNSHSAWLTFMYPRLYIAKQLLSNDGLIFISIDDHEQAQLKLLCDEVFGEENFYAVITWTSTTKAMNAGSAKYKIQKSEEYILVYGRVPMNQHAPFNLDYKGDRLYPFTAADGRKYREEEVQQRKNTGIKRSEKMVFKILGQLPLDGYRWTIGEETAKRLEKSNDIFLRGNKAIQKIYETDEESETFYPLWANFGDGCGTSEDGKATLDNLLKKVHGFDTVKPLDLIQKLAKHFSNDGDVILDFFVGSGTTAHAVMQLNAESNSNRKFICVQLPEATAKNSEAYKAGYETIFDITYDRITKASMQIKASNPLFAGDLGFKIYETVPIPDKYQEDLEELSENLELFDANKLTKTDRQSLMRTWALQDNMPLTLNFMQVDLAGYTAYQVKHILYFIEPNITLDAVVKMLEQLDNNPDFKPSRLVVFGYMLESKIQREMTEAVKQFNNRKGIELTLDVRY